MVTMTKSQIVLQWTLMHEPERNLPDLSPTLNKSLQIQYYKQRSNVQYIE